MGFRGEDYQVGFVQQHDLVQAELTVREILEYAARQMGMEPIMWSVTGYDWNAPSVEHIERQVTRQVGGGDVILLHDGGHLHFGSDRSYTVAATGRLISRYLAEGYEFVTVPEMMRKADVRS
jgi:peptidoglycan/xylan/chitin deacetylase (PgdA/CDA1 family)